MKKTLLFVYLCLFFHSCWSQTILSYEQFQAIVISNHPLIKQAGLKPIMGENQVLKAKGAFDPKVLTEFANKNFDGTRNFQKFNAGLTIPTWYGIQVKTGFESNSGPYLNPELKTPAGGLFYGGLSLNLAQGMMIDQRRAELFKAKINLESSNQEKKLRMNELIYESGYAYWNWFLAHYSAQILSDAYLLSLDRLKGVQTSAELGDRPFIDTVEAGIQVQNRKSMYLNYQTDLQNNRWKVSTYLWSEIQDPLELGESSMPTSLDSISWTIINLLTDQALDSAVQQHPYLNINELKIESLEIDQKLKREQLKPNLNLSYHVINEPLNYNPLTNISPNNNKIGVQFDMPLFLRKERGDYALAQLKVQEEQFNLQSNTVYLKAKIKQAQNDVLNAQNQVQIYQQTVLDSKRLFDAEKQMFDHGESSLFLVNAREMTYIQAKLKCIESISKYQQALLTLKFSLATLY